MNLRACARLLIAAVSVISKQMTSKRSPCTANCTFRKVGNYT